MGAEQAAYFKLLSSLLYNEPSLPAIGMLKREGIFSDIPFAAENKQAAEGRKIMENWLKSATAEELTDKARSDYVKLFIGPGKPLAVPWGSVYLNTEGLLFTEETLKVRQFYELSGMKAVKKKSEPDDHIGLELEFIAYLFKVDKADAAREFAEKFIVPWISQWNADVQKYAATGFYRGLGGMAAGGIDCFISTCGGRGL
jgi:TorA maturation chaperone TorD